MREVRFTVIDVDGTESRSSHEETIAEFFFRRLAQYRFGVFPPRECLNDFIKFGSIDGQFEGRHVIFQWEPFEISERDYAEVADVVRHFPGQPFEIVEVPDTVRTTADFDHWAFVRSLDHIERRSRDDTNVS